MARGSRTPRWRDEAASSLLVRHVPELRLRGPALVMGDPLSYVAESLARNGVEVERWDRRAWGGRRATAWPPEGPFETVFLRLPRSKEELDMTLHGAAGSLVPGGMLLVYGAKDEGIGSATKRMSLLFQDIQVVGVGGHCRVLRGRASGLSPGHKGTLRAWRTLGGMDHPEVSAEWVSYPGVFARGRMDPGTRLLLDHLPRMSAGDRILDFGCGSGVVGGVLASRYPLVRLKLLDIDAVALEAARENVPRATFLLSDGLPPAHGEPFELIVSNPPFHVGKGEDPSMIADLVRGASSLLTKTGRLVLVAQRRLAPEGVFRESFRHVSLQADDGSFRVWEGWEPS